jgi:molybdopterin converting factor small subunit
MARVEVKVWASLSHLFAQDQITPRMLAVEIEDGAPLEALLRKLASDYPGFGEIMFDAATGEPSDQVSVIVNGRLPDLLDGFQTRLHDHDQVSLVQACAGGAGKLLP